MFSLPVKKVSKIVALMDIFYYNRGEHKFAWMQAAVMRIKEVQLYEG